MQGHGQGSGCRALCNDCPCENLPLSARWQVILSMPGALPRASRRLSLIILPTSLCSRLSPPHFTGKELWQAE